MRHGGETLRDLSLLRDEARESNLIKRNTLLHVLSLSTGDLKQYSITCSIKPNLLLEWKENIQTVVELNLTFLTERTERMCASHQESVLILNL